MEQSQDFKQIEAIRSGDEEAFALFFNTHWASLYKEAYFRLRDHDDAQDLVQDIFLSCWQRRDSLVVNTSLQAYLMGALKYKIIRRITKQKLHQDVVEHLLYQMTVIEDSILQAIAAKEIQKTLEEAIDHFPNNMREIILLRMQNFTVGEIAEALALSPQTVKNNTTDALKRLKNVLMEKHPEVTSSFYLALVLFTNN